MNKEGEKSIYIISGPYGVGKSTISKALVQEFKEVALIEGDQIKLMVGGQDPPSWEKQLSLIWQNILSLTKNFIKNDLSVIIDYVVESELDWFSKNIPDVKIHYVVLWADEELLIKRLTKRGEDFLIEGSLYLLNQLESALPNQNYLYDTTNKQPGEIIQDLKNRFSQFIL